MAVAPDAGDQWSSAPQPFCISGPYRGSAHTESADKIRPETYKGEPVLLRKLFPGIRTPGPTLPIPPSTIANS
jgi:hypothetical protein